VASAAVSAVHTATPVSATSGRVLASPVAKKLASERGIDLAIVPGTGPNNRITKYDVLSFKAQPQQPVSAVPSAPVAAPAAVAFAPVDQGQYTDLPLTNMRRVIAKRLQESKSSIPHYYLTSEIVMDKVLK
jgi:pyruvate dehydrogenase E2 component (dihydrolipoamide acetyltransferase)